MNQAEFLCRLNAYDFALHELVLYLDTHPDEQRALQTMTQLREERAALAEKYEAAYGPLIVTVEDVPSNTANWTWVDDPWPWDMPCACTRGEE